MLAARRQLGRPGGAAGDERQRAPRLSDWLLRAVLPPGVDKDNTVLAGTIARTLAQIAVHPIDTIKTRLQVSEPPKKLRKWRKKLGKAKNTLHLSVLGGRGRTLAVPNWAFKGPFDLYRGVSGALLGTLPTALVYFAVYERVSAALEAQPPPPDQSIGEGRGVAGEEASRAPQAHRPRPRSAATVHLLSAAAGAVASSVVRVPGDTVRHQTQAYMHRSVAGAFTSIVASRGVRGLYLGYLPTLCRDVPELAIQFSVYEALRKAVAGRREAAPNGRPQKLATWEHLLLGGLAGAVAACVTMPLDFVKTRQQCGAPGSLASLVRGVVATEGVAGLFQGLAPRVLHVAATSAVFFGLFEGAKLLLKPDREDSDKMLFRKLIKKPRDKVWKRQLVME